MLRYHRLLTVAVVLLLPLPGRADPPIQTATDEDKQLLKEAKIDSDAPALLDFFRKRTPSAAQQTRAANLLAVLGKDAFDVRQKAATELVTLGPAALPQLRRALNDADPEVRQRAAECIEAIDANPRGALAGAAARLLRTARPAAAGAVLLAYLPSADDDSVDDEVVLTLAVLGVRNGKVAVELAAALPDRAPERRAAAALVLGRSGSAEQRAAVRALLGDTDPRVRFRAAQGLLAGRDKDALPALAALLEDAPPALAEQALDLLGCVAAAYPRNRAPIVFLGDTAPSRRRARATWEGWLKASTKPLDLTRAELDLPPFNAPLQMRTAVRQFAAAMARGDLTLFHKTTDVPFYMGPNQILNNRDQLDRLCANIDHMQKRNFALGPLVGMDDYLNTLRQPDPKKFFQPLRKPENRAVYLHGIQEGRRGVVPVFVRLTDGRARVIGTGVAPDGSAVNW